VPDLVVDALGTAVRARVTGLTETEALLIRESWSSALTDEPGTAGEALVELSGSDPYQTAAALSTRVTLAAIESRKADLVMLHACGIADAHGNVAAFVGPSGRGKTTLARSVAQTFGYVTDETVGIDVDGTVHPYRKPLSVIEDERNPTRKRQVAPDTLGLQPLPAAPLRIRAIVLLDRQPGWDGPPEISDVPMRDALIGLVPELSYLPELPDPLLRLASAIDLVGGVKLLRYGEASTVAPVVPELLSSVPTVSPTWVRALPVDQGNVGEGNVGEGNVGRDDAVVFRRSPTLDELLVEGELVILHGREVHVVNGIGPAIWEALRQPSPLAAITAHVVRVHGDPEGADAQGLVEDALDQLSASGLVSHG
jgi:energy-coupling factor transporter ATP-binding protein EcfA2